MRNSIITLVYIGVIAGLAAGVIYIVTGNYGAAVWAFSSAAWAAACAVNIKD